jgi:hypothetical protein
MVAISPLVCWTQSPARVCGTAVLEIRVHACLLGGDAACGVVDEHLFEEVEAVVVEVCAEGLGFVADPFWE